MKQQVEVLIIGGGFAGVAAAQTLQKGGIRSLLVDAKDYFEVTFATLRDVANPNYTGNRARKFYRDFLTAEYLQGRVTELTESIALLEDGTEIEFDKAIIASGSHYPTMSIAKSREAMNLLARNSELLAEHQHLTQAQSVLVIGGGVVGVELAGELAHAFPDKPVTLAYRGQTLLPGFKPKAQKLAHKQLTRLGVKLKPNSDYQQQSSDYVDSQTQQVADADIVFEATGMRPNNQFLLPHLGHILDDNGFVKVNSQLQVEGHRNLYALGDIAAVGEGKLGYLALGQGKFLAQNLIAQARGKKVKNYRRNPFMALVPVGPEQGLVQLPFAVTTARFMVNMKQKDLFISKVYKDLGTTPNIGDTKLEPLPDIAVSS